MSFGLPSLYRRGTDIFGRRKMQHQSRMITSTSTTPINLPPLPSVNDLLMMGREEIAHMKDLKTSLRNVSTPSSKNSNAPASSAAVSSTLRSHKHNIFQSTPNFFEDIINDSENDSEDDSENDNDENENDNDEENDDIINRGEAGPEDSENDEEDEMVDLTPSSSRRNGNTSTSSIENTTTTSTALTTTSANNIASTNINAAEIEEEEDDFIEEDDDTEEDDNDRPIDELMSLLDFNSSADIFQMVYQSPLLGNSVRNDASQTGTSSQSTDENNGNDIHSNNNIDDALSFVSSMVCRGGMIPTSSSSSTSTSTSASGRSARNTDSSARSTTDQNSARVEGNGVAERRGSPLSHDQGRNRNSTARLTPVAAANNSNNNNGNFINNNTEIVRPPSLQQQVQPQIHSPTAASSGRRRRAIEPTNV